ncbi:MULTISPECIES: hypothetical protein [Actinomyces]|uniref:hypothetical protein n=1 Tax=Actinomyces TaxID=1654 RepID=UPI000A5E8F7B|nr:MULTISPECIES: hypothetical protein [Actinomyces]
MTSAPADACGIDPVTSVSDPSGEAMLSVLEPDLVVREAAAGALVSLGAGVRDGRKEAETRWAARFTE